MPFVSKKQMKLCYVLQKKGLNKGWNCKEWSSSTDYETLPDRVVKKSRSRGKSRSRSRSRSRKIK